MYGLSGPRGMEPTPLVAPATASSTPAVSTSSPVSVSATGPLDQSQALLQASHGTGPLSQGFGDLAPAGPTQLRQFFHFNGEIPASYVKREGDRLVVHVEDQAIRVSVRDLQAGLVAGQIDPHSHLVASLELYELAINASLPQSAAMSLVKRFDTLMRAGMDPLMAKADVMGNVALAAEVEAYVEHKQGLSTDMRLTSEFSQQATGGKWSHLFRSSSQAAKEKAIHRLQEQLNESLHAFAEAFPQARADGDYAAAFDSLGAYFKTCASVTDEPYWHGRSMAFAKALVDQGPRGVLARCGGQETRLSLAVDQAKDFPMPKVRPDERLVDLLETNAGHAPTQVVLRDDHYEVMVGEEVFSLHAERLKETLSEGVINSQSPLVEALKLFDTLASHTSLTEQGVQAFVRRFADRVNGGEDMMTAKRAVYREVGIAIRVERYVDEGEMEADFRSANGHERRLEQLRGLGDLYAQAHNSGDYGAVYEALEALHPSDPDEPTIGGGWSLDPGTLSRACSAGDELQEQRGYAVQRFQATQAGSDLAPKRVAPQLPEEPAPRSGPPKTSLMGGLKEGAARGMRRAGHAISGALRAVGDWWQGLWHKPATTMPRVCGSLVPGAAVVAPPKPAPPPPYEGPPVAPPPYEGPAPVEPPPPYVGPDAMLSDRPTSALERKTARFLSNLVSGQSHEVNASLVASLGLSADLDLVPVAGQTVTELLGLSASVGIRAEASGEVALSVERTETGGVKLGYEAFVGVGDVAEAAIAAEALGVELTGSVGKHVGHLKKVELTFASPEDAARFLSHPRSHGLAAADEAGPGREYKLETVSALAVRHEGEVSKTGWRRATDRATSTLPGTWWTGPSLVTSQWKSSKVEYRQGDDLVQEVAFEASTSRPRALARAHSTHTLVEGTIRRGDEGVSLEAGSASIDLSLGNLRALSPTFHPGKSDEALDILARRMTESLNRGLRRANTSGYRERIDTGATEAAVRGALALLREHADGILSGNRLSSFALKLPWLTLTLGNMATLKFDLAEGEDTRFRLVSPQVGVTSGQGVEFDLDVGIVGLSAEVGHAGFRPVQGVTV